MDSSRFILKTLPEQGWVVYCREDKAFFVFPDQDTLLTLGNALFRQFVPKGHRSPSKLSSIILDDTFIYDDPLPITRESFGIQTVEGYLDSLEDPMTFLGQLGRSLGMIQVPCLIVPQGESFELYSLDSVPVESESVGNLFTECIAHRAKPTEFIAMITSKLDQSHE